MYTPFLLPTNFSPIATPIWFFNQTVTSANKRITTFWLTSHSNLHSKFSNHFIQSQILPCPFKNPQIYPFSPLFRISMPKTVYLHFLKFQSKTVPLLPLLRHFFTYHDTNLIFSTTLLLVPPSKSQLFYSYLTQFSTLNSQIIFMLSQRPLCPFPNPQIYPFSSFLKLAYKKNCILSFFKFE